MPNPAERAITAWRRPVSVSPKPVRAEARAMSQTKGYANETLGPPVLRLAVAAKVDRPVDQRRGFVVFDRATDAGLIAAMGRAHRADPVLRGNAVGGRDRDDVAAARLDADLPQRRDQCRWRGVEHADLAVMTLDDLAGAVGRVVDDDDLDVGVRLGQDGREAFGNARPRVVRRDYHGEARRAAFDCRASYGSGPGMSLAVDQTARIPSGVREVIAIFHHLPQNA